MVDVVLKLGSDGFLRHRMDREGRRRMEAYFSAAATADKVDAIISRTLERRNSGSVEPRVQ